MSCADCLLDLRKCDEQIETAIEELADRAGFSLSPCSTKKACVISMLMAIIAEVGLHLDKVQLPF